MNKTMRLVLAVSGKLCRQWQLPSCSFSTSRLCPQMEAVATQVLTPVPAVKEKKGTKVVEHDTEWPYQDHTVTIQTCADLYKDWRRWKPGYQNAPSQGIEVEVPYLNTGFDRHGTKWRDQPTVLLLHGAPGSYRDFPELIPYLDKHGANIISPRWPDLQLSYRTGTFWHSAEEKTHLLKDFLKAIKVDKIDLVIAHSSAIYPSLNLLTKEDMPNAKALALLAPAGHQTVRAIKPLPLMRAFAIHYTNPKYQNFMRRLGVGIMKFTRSPIKPNMEDAIMSLQTMIFSDYEQAGDKIKQIADSKLPMLIAFSESDRAINPYIISNMVRHIGTPDKDLWLYDGDGNLVREGAKEDSKKVLLFKKGGHYLFKRHPEVINPAILQLLHKVSPPNL
ncbi:uncharacterized protein LOC135393924 isoform X2 [Ornithodoros turicata]